MPTNKKNQSQTEGPNALEQDREQQSRVQQSRDAVGHKPEDRGDELIRQQEGRAGAPRGDQSRREDDR